jgi:hypothetical protein
MTMAKVEKNDDDLLTDHEAVEQELPKRITVNTLAFWRWKKKGPPWVRLGHSVFYRRRDLRDFIRASTIKPGEK